MLRQIASLTVVSRRRPKGTGNAEVRRCLIPKTQSSPGPFIPGSGRRSDCLARESAATSTWASPNRATALKELLAHPATAIRKLGLVQSVYRDWPAILLAWAGDRSAVRIFKLRNGLRMQMRPRTNDFYVVDEILRLGVYSPPGWGIAEDAIVVDVGAHIGVFTVLASRFATSGRVIAIEPQADNFAMLKANIALNGCRNVVPVNAALAGMEGPRKLYLSPTACSHSLSPIFDRSIIVPARTLESIMHEFALDRIDYLKVDCEGAEYEIIEGLPDRVLEAVSSIAMEYHPAPAESGVSDLSDILTAHGFRVAVRPTWARGGMLYAVREASR